MFFGDHCATSIIIKDILGKRDKLLFMLGGFPFRRILDFLRDDRWDDIYDPSFLRGYQHFQNEAPTFSSEVERFSHLADMDHCVTHTKYHFNFHHDFLFDPEKNTITNYDFIKAKYQEKIANTRNMFFSDPTKPLVFLNFCFPAVSDTSVTECMDDMCATLRGLLPAGKPFYILVFSDDKDRQFAQPNVVGIHLSQPVEMWHTRSLAENRSLYKEIYITFHRALQRFGLEHHFPVFAETPYYREHG